VVTNPDISPLSFKILILKDILVYSKLPAERFVVAHHMIKDINAQVDNLTLKTRFKEIVQDDKSCNNVGVFLKGEDRDISLFFFRKGCESYVYLRIGEHRMKGATRSLSAFTTHIAQWHDVKLKVVNKQVEVFLDRKLIYTSRYTILSLAAN